MWGIKYNVSRDWKGAGRCIKVGFRVTEAERDRLLAYCEKMNLTQAQVFKEALELLYKTKP